MPDPLVVVGGGLATARLVRGYREAGGGEHVIVLSADAEAPYHRPPLSKSFLRGAADRDDVLVESRGFYTEHGVDLRLRSDAEALDTESRLVRLAGGESVRYGTLVLATGAVPRALGVPGAELDGVFTLRTVVDATAIRDAARDASRALVVGGSFIGTEVAASLAQRGLEVTLVHQGRRLHDRLRLPELSAFLGTLFERMEIGLRLGDEVVELVGNGRAARARLRSGDELDADLVVAGIGVEPAVGPAHGTRLELDDGIVVDERFQTTVEDVYAIGDVARFHDPVLGRRRRIEHWDNASYQGDVLGRLLAGDDDAAGYDHVSMFFTDLFDVSFEVVGDVEQQARTVCRGSFDDRDAIACYLDPEDRLVAALLVGQSEETTAALSDLIRARARWADPAAFADPAAGVAAAFTEPRAARTGARR